MNESHYFPPLCGEVDCGKCEISADCTSCGRYQRNRRDFTYTSGRCPRLADKRGFVENWERDLYAATFPLVGAEQGCEELHLTLTIPGEKRSKKVYRTRSGYWYYKAKDADGFPAKKVITIETGWDERRITDYMKSVYADYCLFRCTLEDYCV